MSLPISVCIIARDEARTLPACLDSVVPHVAQVVVVDTGSNDATPQIARQRGALVRSFNWIDDFSAARNFVASLATQPLIFMLDADERLDLQTVPALAAYCDHANPCAGIVRRLNVEDDGITPLTTDSLTRLYPNTPDYGWNGRVHEQLVYRGGAPQRSDSGVQLIHTGYGAHAVAAKIQRNLHLLHLANTDSGSAEPYMLYQLGRTCEAAGRHTEAVEYLGAALDQLIGRPPETVPYLSILLLQLGYALLHTRDFVGLFSVLSLATELYPDYTDLYFLYGSGLMELNDPQRLDDIRAAFEQCLALGEADPVRYESVAGVGSFRAAHNLAAYYASTTTPLATPTGTSAARFDKPQAP